MAEAILSGMLAGGFLPEDILVRDVDAAKLERLAGKYGVGITREEDFFDRVSLVVLAVKPQVLPKVLEESRSRISGEHLLVSIAAGIPLGEIARTSGSERIVRVMPNTPALIGQGMSALCSLKPLRKEETALVERIFSAVGDIVWLEEVQFDAVTALSGSGPAYLFRFADALIDSGVLLGLPRDLSRKLVVQTLAGSASMIRETGESPRDLEAKVTSPGGTTIHGLMAMEDGGFSSAVKDGVLAARDRAAELGRK